MFKSSLPRFRLVTNDSAALLRREPHFPAAALRYTHPGMRGLFGGIWRTGRIYDVDSLGPCFGPEIFFLFGADEKEAREAFDQPRSVVMAREAAAAKNACRYAAPVAREFGGRASLKLGTEDDDRHWVHAFIPIDKPMDRFQPHEWFAFWKDHDLEFQRGVRLEASAPAQKSERAA